MSEAFVFEDHLVQEASFAAAYDTLTSQQRSWLKTAIARLYVLLGSEQSASTTVTRQWRQGFYSSKRKNAIDSVVVVAAPGMHSPIRLLATVLPAMAAGVNELSVFLPLEAVDSHSPLLTALELAGCETVAWFDPHEDVNLSQACNDTAAIKRIVFLGEGMGGIATDATALSNTTPVLRLEPAPLKAGIWWKEDEPLALDVIAWCHPGIPMQVWNGEPKSPKDSWQWQSGDWEEFVSAGFDVVYVPCNMAESAAGRIPLVLAPGNEMCWVWPELTKDFFQACSVSLWSEK